MRPIWKGYLAFGLVSIPVRVYAATEKGGISFNQLHKDCHHRIRYQKRCPHCDVDVTTDDIVRGYDLGADRYVVITDDELEQFDTENTRAIEIVAFVDASEVDPIYFESPYYLEPAEVGHKPYKLLRTALRQSGRAALARVVMRRRASLALVRVYEGGLILNMIHWPEEIRGMEKLEGLSVDPEVSEKELGMAMMLIDNLTVPFDPKAYPDEYTRDLRSFIEGKVQEEASGEETRSIVSPSRQVIDIMSALEASLRATKPKTSKGTRKKEGA